MKSLTILIIAVSVRHAVSLCHERDSVQKCIPDSKYFVYDNMMCNCNSDGTDIICKEDETIMTGTPLFHRRQLLNMTLNCVPHRLFEFRCHDCLCDRSGKYATCVRKMSYPCLVDDPLIDNPERCIPGAVFQSDCFNGCICGADGKAACTKLDCSMERKDPACVPNSTYIDRCNDCYCTDDGRSFCNRMGCSQFSFEHSNQINITMSCQAKSIFNRNCHECICSNNGDYAICYGKSCSNFDNTMDTKDQCTPGMVFVEDCNVCVCGDDGKGVCTTTSCNLSYRLE